jgi:hypothetical protein
MTAQGDDGAARGGRWTGGVTGVIPLPYYVLPAFLPRLQIYRICKFVLKPLGCVGCVWVTIYCVQYYLDKFWDVIDKAIPARTFRLINFGVWVFLLLKAHSEYLVIALNGSDGEAVAAIAKVVFEFPEVDTDDLHMQFYPIGAQSPFLPNGWCRGWNRLMDAWRALLTQLGQIISRPDAQAMAIPVWFSSTRQTKVNQFFKLRFCCGH